MDLKKPIWLVVVLCVAILAFQVGFKPLRWVSAEAAVAEDELKYEVGKELVGPGQDNEEAEQEIRELLLEDSTIHPKGLLDVHIYPRGIMTDFDYNATGMSEKVTRAVGTADQIMELIERDDAGNVTAFTNANDNRTEFV